MTAAIRTLRTVGERLDAWLAEDRPLPPKGEWQALAQSLGVTREALYRDRDTIGGHYTLVWQKIDGQWVIISDHSS